MGQNGVHEAVHFIYKINQITRNEALQNKFQGKIQGLKMIDFKHRIHANLP